MERNIFLVIEEKPGYDGTAIASSIHGNAARPYNLAVKPQKLRSHCK